MGPEITSGASEIFWPFFVPRAAKMVRLPPMIPIILSMFGCNYIKYIEIKFETTNFRSMLQNKCFDKIATKPTGT